MATIAVLAAFHETNTFNPRHTDQAQFVEEGWYHGDELLERYRGTKTVMGGFLDGLAEAEHAPRGGFGAYAVPAGTVTNAAFSQIRQEILDGLRRAEPYEGVLVELHGAMVTESETDPDAIILSDMRAEAGDRPIVVVTDFHANHTAARLASVDLLIGYRTNPHIDTWESGRNAARFLDARLRGQPRPAVAFGSLPVIVPPIAQLTAENPWSGWLVLARELERRYDLVDVTVAGGFSHADVPHAGVSVVATGNADTVVQVVGELCQHIGPAGVNVAPAMLPPDEAMARARAASGTGLVAVADTGDNINGGSPGNEVELITCARESSLHIMTTFASAQLADAAQETPVGGSVALPPDLGMAVGAAHAELSRHLSGRFTNRGPMATGKAMDMGPSAVLHLPWIDIIVQRRAMQPNDPEMFRSAGLEPTTADVVLLKGASALRAGWAGVARTFIAAATRGVTDCVLDRLPYRRLAGQVHPLTGTPARPPTVELVTPHASRP